LGSVDPDSQCTPAPVNIVRSDLIAPRSAIDDGTLFLAEGPKNIVNSVAAIFDELDDGIAATEYFFFIYFNVIWFQLIIEWE
jgi:hypothetical protein